LCGSSVRECAVMAIELEDRRTTLKAFVVMNIPVTDPKATTRNVCKITDAARACGLTADEVIE
jgi:hypothetical protein